jgi:TniQ
MTALRITVDLGTGETTASLASRLAAANRLRAQDFCLDWGIRFQAVVDGVETAVAAIADKAGVALPDLMSHAYIRGTGLNYTHRGQALTRFSLRRATVMVCPMCLAADMAASSREPHLAAYGRALWQIDAIKDCPVHGIALMAVSSDMSPNTLHDFAYHVAPVLAGINHLVAEAQPREMTGLQSYIIARLDGGCPSPFLDGIELHAAIKFCEVLGAVELFGRMTNLNELSNDDWRLAGAAGFEITAGGPASIGAFLTQLAQLGAGFSYFRGFCIA